MGVLTDLKACGVQDIRITCIDNLYGFTDTVRTVFPQSFIQSRMVYQIRNFCKQVVYEDKKEFTADMKISIMRLIKRLQPLNLTI